MKTPIFLFDFDGTLADSGEGIMNSAACAIARMGKTVPDRDILRKFIGPPLHGSFANLAGMDEEEVLRAVEYFRENFAESGMYQMQIYPGIPSMLNELRAQGAYLGVVTGKADPVIRACLNAIDMTDFFDVISAPDPNNRSADKTGLILRALPEGAGPQDAVMVGDRCFDIDAAHGLHMKAVAVSYGFGSRDEFKNADFIAQDVPALRNYLTGNAQKAKGKLITFEGTDGCGKTTQIKNLTDFLKKRGWEVVNTREPGGCKISERIREIILSVTSDGMSPECEALLYAASRAQHIQDVILPSLNEGKIVLCDRFLDSSLAYQGSGRQLGEDFIRLINRAAGCCEPDRTLYFKIDRAKARARMAQGAPLDRLEREREDFFERIDASYDRIAGENPDRIVTIDAQRGVDEVFADVLAAVKPMFMERR